MRVLFFFGGMPHYLISLLNTICKKGIDIYVIIPEGRGLTIGSSVKLEEEGVRFNIIRLNEYRTYYRKYFFKKVISAIDSIKPDILVMGWPYILSLFFLPGFLYFLKRRRIKIIFREIPFQVPPFKRASAYLKKNPVYTEDLKIVKIPKIALWSYLLVRKYCYAQSDATINYCDNAFTIQPTYGVKKEDIFICHNTPDTDSLFKAKEELTTKPHVLDENIHRIIHVGRLIKWKRVDLLLKVTAKLKIKYPDIELVIIGNGPEKENLKKLINKLEINQSVIWVGKSYDYTDLGRYFLVSSVYVMAGYGGLSVNEAMGFGKPIVCSVGDGTEKLLVRPNYNGLFFKAGDEQDLYNQLDYLFSNPDKISIFGENSEKIIREEINLKSVSEKYVSAFNYVLKKQ